MNIMRKLLGFFTAVAFVAMAAPATAQNVKYFELKQTVPNPANPMPVTTTNVTVTFKNGWKKAVTPIADGVPADQTPGLPAR